MDCHEANTSRNDEANLKDISGVALNMTNSGTEAIANSSILNEKCGLQEASVQSDGTIRNSQGRSILDEKSGLCGSERGNKTKESIDEVSDKLHDLSLKDKPYTQGDIVLDFFAGSGTTAHAVLELNREDGGNRKFILVTNNEITPLNPGGIAMDVTSKRLKRIMSGECYPDENGVCDKSFKWLEKNTPYGDNLQVCEIASCTKFDESILSKINERLYNLPKFQNPNEKIKWICENFENAAKKLVMQVKNESDELIEKDEKEYEESLKKGLGKNDSSSH